MGEAGVVAVSAENGVYIPLKNLFEKASLDKLPM